MFLPTLRLPSSPPRRRPVDLVYADTERPPAGPLLMLAVQHAGTAMAFIAYVLVAAHMAGLERAATQSIVAMTLLAMALGTSLHAWGGCWGSGSLLVLMPSAFMIPLTATLLAEHGPGGLSGATLVYGATAIALAPLVRRLRPMFPPPVVGAVICMGGITLVAPSVRHALGVGEGHWQINGASALVSGITLGSIVLLTIWGGRLRLLALMLAITAGVVVSALLGFLDGAQALQNAPWLALPKVSTPVFGLDIGMVVAAMLVAVLSQLDTIGGVTIMNKMEDADWKRADMRAIGGGIRANGLANLCFSMLGSYPVAISSANIALTYATRSTARMIGLAAGALLALVAFLPQVTLALTLVPEPVLGAVGLYASVFLVVSGMELAMSRAIDSRVIFAIGLSMCTGLAVLQMPQLTQNLPHSVRFLLGQGFVVAGMLVIALNLLFRLGSARRAELKLQADSTTLQTDITGFVEAQGATWGARRAVVQRAALAALEAVEAIAVAGDGRRVTCLRGYFDEFNLDLELLHTGAPLALTPSAVPASAALLDSDDSKIDDALAQVSTLLLRHLADRVSTGQSAQHALLHLHFEH